MLPTFRNGDGIVYFNSDGEGWTLEGEGECAQQQACQADRQK